MGSRTGLRAVEIGLADLEQPPGWIYMLHRCQEDGGGAAVAIYKPASSPNQDRITSSSLCSCLLGIGLSVQSSPSCIFSFPLHSLRYCRSPRLTLRSNIHPGEVTLSPMMPRNGYGHVSDILPSQGQRTRSDPCRRKRLAGDICKQSYRLASHWWLHRHASFSPLGSHLHQPRSRQQRDELQHLARGKLQPDWKR